MGDFTGGGSSTAGPSSVAKEAIGSQTKAKRESYIRKANGDLVGNDYVVGKGDFAHFMGYKPPTAEEAAGKAQMSSSRTIEVALQKEMTDLGMGAAKHGNSYRNIAISWGRFANDPGREKDMIKDGIDAIRQGPDKNSMESRGLKATSGGAAYLEKAHSLQKESHNDNVKLLEMQYKFLEISKNQGVISNLMKVRHDSVTRSIRGQQG